MPEQIVAEAAVTDNQTVCRGTAITSITYTRGGTATGISVTGLPTGVTSNVSGTNVTISGTPTVAGTYTYTVSTTGGTCAAATATGTITVNAATIALSSGTSTQTVCSGSAITNIVYNIGGVATGATVTGLPAGVSGNYSAGLFTISGTPTVTGTFGYTVTTSGGSCGTPTATGTITINPVPSVANQTATICNGSTFTVSPTGVPGGTTYSWTAPVMSSGVSGGYAATGQTSVSQALWAGSQDGTAVYTVTPQNGTCAGSTFTVTVTINAQPYPSYGSATICSGSAFSVVPPSLPTGTTFSWSSPTGSGFTGGTAASNQASVNGTLG